jgi:MFS family permease
MIPARFAFATPSFLRLMVGFATSKIGSIVYTVALSWYLVDTQESPAMLGLVLTANILPTALLSPVAGILVDRHGKKMLIVLCDVVAGLAMLAVAAQMYMGVFSLPTLLVASALLGATTSVFRPAVKAIIPALVAREHLAQANATQRLLVEVSRVSAPPLAAILLAFQSLGIAGIFVLNGVTFLLSAWLELGIRDVPPLQRKAAGFLTDLVDGLKHLGSRAMILQLLGLAVVTNFFLGAFEVFSPVFARNLLGGGAELYALSLSFQAIGGIMAATWVIVRVDRLRADLSLVGYLLLIGLAFVFLSLIQQPAAYLAACFAVGVGLAGFNSVFFAMVQDQIDEAFLGRSMSIVYLIALIIMPVSFLVAGYAAEVYKNRIALMLLVSGVALGATLLAFWAASSNQRKK